MREIKFRAWDKKEKKMQYLKNIGICYEYSCLTFQGDSYSGICEWPTGDDSEIENQEIMQYTGLNDKNGKESYDGDILKWFYSNYAEPCIAEVTFSNGRFDIPSEEFEIIGNIYQNPELLK